MHNILVTGGLGFIGSCFVRQACRMKDTHAVVLDKVTYASNFDALQEVHGQFEFYRGDIADYSLVRMILHRHQIKTVVNFAAETHVERSIIDQAPFLQTNIEGVSRLIHTVKDHVDGNLRRDGFKFLYVSTDEVYGELGLEEDRLFDDNNLTYAPNSPYSASKAAAEHVLRAYSHTFKLPVAFVHPANNYGPWQHPEKLIPRMVSLAHLDQPLTIHGSGRNVREWIQVDDCCRAIWQVIDKGVFATPGEHYNIGSGEERSNVQIIEAVKRILLDRTGTRTRSAQVPDRPGNDMRYAVDSTKIRSLGWQPKHDFARGLEDTVMWNWSRLNSDESI